MSDNLLEKTLAPTSSKMLVLLFLTAIVVYWRTLGFEFSLDDLTHLVENPAVHTLRGTIRSLFLPASPGNLYRPIVALSYGITYHFFALNPFPYHLTNVTLNALNVVLLFAVLQRTFSLPIAGWTALLFAVVPIHSEAVANVHGRTELLACAFGFLFLFLLPGAKSPKLPRLLRFSALSAILFLALGSKESAIVFPLIGALLLHRERVLRPAAPTLVLSTACAMAVYFLLRIGALHEILVPNSISSVDNFLVTFPWPARALSGFMLLGKYLWLCVLPWRLSADYSFAELSPIAPQGSIATYFFTMLAGLTFSYMFIARRSSALYFFVAWFFLAFAVTGNVFFPIGTIFAERLAYVPSVATAGALVFCIERFGRPAWREYVLGAITIAYAGVTMAHLPVWRNSESLAWYQHEVAPRSVKSATNLAVALRNDGSYNYALAEIKRAKELLPTYDQASFVEATIFTAKGDTNEAHAALLHTLELNPNHLEALRMLGVMALNAATPETGDLDTAEAYFRRMLSIDGGNHQAEVGLFAVALKRGRLDGAEKMWRELQASDPHNAELARLGGTLHSMLAQREQFRVQEGQTKKLDHEEQTRNAL